jgi:hypothetical protein
LDRLSIQSLFPFKNPLLKRNYPLVPSPTLYHFEAKAFLMGRGDGRARPAGGRALTAAASAQRALAATQKESLYWEMLLLTRVAEYKGTGYPITLVADHPRNFKITYEPDLLLARLSVKSA